MARTKAQSTMEYIVFIGVATVAIFYMGPAIKRGLQSLVKVTADQIGNQQMADQNIDKPIDNGYVNPDPDELLSETVHKEYSGYLVGSTSSMHTESNRSVTERKYASEVSVDEITNSISNSVTDLGFTKTK